MKLLLMASAGALLLAGCASPYSEYYVDQIGSAVKSNAKNIVISNEEPKLYRGSRPDVDSQIMAENNFVQIGYSSFNAGDVDEKKAIDQAKAVRASVVMIYSSYTGTVTGAAPLTLPDVKTSSTNISGTAYGYGGTKNFSGAATTTSYGTKTTYIPFAVHRSDYGATYWVKMKPRIFGVNVDDLPPEVRKRIGSNKGVLVKTVIKDSPAFHADILPGDVIKRIGETDVTGGDSFSRATELVAGSQANVLLIRETNELSKQVQFGEKPDWQRD